MFTPRQQIIYIPAVTFFNNLTSLVRLRDRAPQMASLDPRPDSSITFFLFPPRHVEQCELAWYKVNSMTLRNFNVFDSLSEQADSEHLISDKLP